jgi:hypothetical protein
MSTVHKCTNCTGGTLYFTLLINLVFSVSGVLRYLIQYNGHVRFRSVSDNDNDKALLNERTASYLFFEDKPPASGIKSD